MTTSGYSGTPLAKKLSLKEGMRVWRDGMPDGVADEIAAEGLQLQLLQAPEAPLDVAHIFVTSRGQLEAKLRKLMPLLVSDGMIWVSWPKKASKVATEMSEDAVRDIALPMHLVDVKVCSVDDIWSGLKLVVRKEHR
jgi:hypothetical protein